MRMSLSGRTFLAREEGIVLVGYQDSGDVPTIGIGHTAADGVPVIVGQRITLEQAVTLLDHDLLRYESEVTRALKVPVTQYQFDALVSFHYNTGGILRAQLTKDLNAGVAIQTVGEDFLHWELAGGDPHKLKGRREREEALFLYGQYGDLSGVPVWTDYPGRARKIAMPLPGGAAGPDPVTAPISPSLGGAFVPGPDVSSGNTTVVGTVGVVASSGALSVLSYIQTPMAIAALALLIAGGLAAWVIWTHLKHEKMRGF